MLKIIYLIRRNFLKRIVPEFIWPKYVQFDGAKIPVRSMDYTFGVKYVLTRGNYENNERNLLKKVLKPGDEVLEMGTSIGVVTAVIHNLIGSSGKIITIEASAKLAKQSSLWLSEIGDIVVLNGFGFPVLVAPEKYRNLKFMDDGNSLGGYVDLESHSANVVQTNIYDLNKIQEEYEFYPSVLVLDIEGSERIYLEENISMPENVKTIIIEMHPGMYGSEIEKQIIDRLVKFGFKNTEELNHVYLLSKHRFNG